MPQRIICSERPKKSNKSIKNILKFLLSFFFFFTTFQGTHDSCFCIAGQRVNILKSVSSLSTVHKDNYTECYPAIKDTPSKVQARGNFETRERGKVQKRKIDVPSL